MAMMKAPSHRKFTSGRIWKRTLHLPAPTTASTAEIERELAEEDARPKDALALAMTSGEDHGEST